MIYEVNIDLDAQLRQRAVVDPTAERAGREDVRLRAALQRLLPPYKAPGMERL
ncbi:MAG: hypothetical protein AVDCRST_MAG71-2523 [uncultured Lysobacter sp.]|uniref:Uncharacterized protein n=1 Tax=uncultured Lysobacter sp. TaxID=271060 RepID=A0A6J4M2U0_9GAMM|nr:MAG: hypothetical protein AVDCRST_MAG71-2523 [uncultured Lysobacter sp.]